MSHPLPPFQKVPRIHVKKSLDSTRDHPFNIKEGEKNTKKILRKIPPPQKKLSLPQNHLEKTVQKAKAPLISMISSCDFNSASTSQRAAMTSSSGGAGSSGAGSGTGGISRSIRDLVTCQAVVAEVSRSGCYKYQMYIVDIWYHISIYTQLYIYIYICINVKFRL